MTLELPKLTPFKAGWSISMSPHIKPTIRKHQ